MKLLVVLSIAALASCDYPAAQPEAPAEAYGTPASEPAEGGDHGAASPSSAPVDAARSRFDFQTFRGAFAPAPVPRLDFLSRFTFPSRFSYKYPLRTFDYAPSQVSFAASPQGILPPVSQVVPPISQIVPPIVGGVAQPAVPVSPPHVFPPQVFPPQAFPPQTFANKPVRLFSSQFPQHAYNYGLPLYYNYAFPHLSNFGLPYSFSFPSATSFSAPAPPRQEPPKTPEPLSASYGTPASAPAESSAPFEPSGPAENSAPFEQPQTSYPYEPAAPEAPEPSPYKPAQEYGFPTKK